MLNKDQQEKCFALFDEWARKYNANFTIALSGGGDSLALCHIIKKWRDERGNNAKINACIIDHRIAPNSHIVAQDALARAKQIGINGEIIALSEKITSKIQENARKFRYQEIFKYAAKNNSKIILLGHNRGDQIETIIFRMLRETGLDGLCAMRELQLVFQQELGSFLIARPLLSINRDELREYLKNENIDYYDDPANVSHKFSRVKIRNFLENAKNLDSDRLLNIAKHAAKLRNYFENNAHEYLRKNLVFEGEQVRLKGFEELSEFQKPRIIEIIIQAFNYPKYRPNREKIERLLLNGLEKPQTLGGVKVWKSKNLIKFAIAPPRKGRKIAISCPNWAIIDAICNYCS